MHAVLSGQTFKVSTWGEKVKLVTDKKTGISYEMQSAKEITAVVAWLVMFTAFIALAALTFHEFSHLWGSAMHGTPDCMAWFKFKYIYGFPIPVSGYAGVSGWWAWYAGGVITGVVFILAGLWAFLTKTIEDFYIEFAFFAVGLSHLFYGLLEGNVSALLGCLSWDSYQLLAHAVQISGVVIVVVFTFRKLKLYLLAGGGFGVKEFSAMVKK